MKKNLLLGLVSIAIMLTLSACGTSQIQNVPAQPITEQVSDVDVFKAIYKAGMARGWEMHKISDGLIEATYARRGFTVTISINYNATSYSISYKSSEGLKYDPDSNTIHRNYNSWIQNLKRQINGELALIGASSSGMSVPATATSNTSTTDTMPEANENTSGAPVSDW